jgi:tetrapyrrole methylase family protein / MazG family protein
MPDAEEMDRYQELRAVVARLRAPDGCPWDREQTHASLRPYLLQEAYEVLSALDDDDTERLPDELGDLLWQILIHTQLAEEAGEFTMTDVLTAVTAKLVRRHPHVFGEEEAGTAAEVEARWESLKRRERDEKTSVVASVPEALPALAYAQELLRRAGSAGFEWPRREDVVAKLAEEVDELARTENVEQRTEEFGDILINLANYARYIGIDAEEALRLAARKFRRRFQSVEAAARESGKPLNEMPIDDLIEAWSRAKDEPAV